MTRAQENIRENIIEIVLFSHIEFCLILIQPV